MNCPKKQHWVPRLYLKQFAIPETINSKIPKVWAFSKLHRDPKEPKLISIKDAASSRFMYSPTDEKGNHDYSTEKRLENLETLVAHIWPDICYDAMAFSGPVRKVVSLFLATIMLRDQRSFNLIKAIHSRLYSFFDSFPKDKLGVPQINKLIYQGKEHELDLSDWRDIKCCSDNYMRQCFVETINNGAIDFAKILLDKNWSIRTFSKPLLATSDAPLIICNPNRETYGISTKGTIIFLPLTPFRALEIGHKGKDNVCYPMSDEYAHLINYLLWTSGCRFIYSHRNTDEVLLDICNLVHARKDE